MRRRFALWQARAGLSWPTVAEMSMGACKALAVHVLTTLLAAFHALSPPVSDCAAISAARAMSQHIGDLGGRTLLLAEGWEVPTVLSTSMQPICGMLEPAHAENLVSGQRLTHHHTSADLRNRGSPCTL